MVINEDDDLSWTEAFVRSSKNRCTLDLNDITKPFVTRGIVKRKNIHHCQNTARPFYYMDTGYFGNFTSKTNPQGKKKWHRIVKNELQKSTIEKDWPSDRWEALVEADSRLEWKGWKKGGDKILLVLPNPKSCNFFGMNYDEWYNKTINFLKNNTDKKIVTRKKGSRGDRNTYSIYDALDDGVFATVTFNSIAAMESIAYGVPAFVEVPCAAWPLASQSLQNINQPYYPDPDLVKQHCYSLAYGQFTRQEIDNGTAWKILNSK